MPGYLVSENANAMMKAMMVKSSCHTVKGDDTASNGFKLIVDEDEECNCQVVRALAPGTNTRIRVDSNNVLRVDALSEPALQRVEVSSPSIFEHIATQHDAS